MTLVKLDLMSKNNQKRGTYLYVPIVWLNNEYYRCSAIHSTSILKKSQVKESDIHITSKILPEFYAANNLVATN